MLVLFYQISHTSQSTPQSTSAPPQSSCFQLLSAHTAHIRNKPLMSRPCDYI